MRLKSVLKKAEQASKKLKNLKLKNLKLNQIKISSDNPNTGHYRLKGYFTDSKFVEIFEFYFSGNLLKYSYVYIKEGKSILRFDNAPYHKELKSFPNHKHKDNDIYELPNPTLDEFV
jgi:hypothetical protein